MFETIYAQLPSFLVAEPFRLDPIGTLVFLRALRVLRVGHHVCGRWVPGHSSGGFPWVPRGQGGPGGV
eukprot:7350545-Pyramimonas_sp.AAC.1